MVVLVVGEGVLATGTEGGVVAVTDAGLGCIPKSDGRNARRAVNVRMMRANTTMRSLFITSRPCFCGLYSALRTCEVYHAYYDADGIIKRGVLVSTYPNNPGAYPPSNVNDNLTCLGVVPSSSIKSYL
jgi:hypothetical protein